MSRSTRREFISGAMGLYVARGPLILTRPGWPTDKLNVACIGAGGRGRASVDGCRNENIVAICDVDEERLNKTARDFPVAKKYVDYREMLEREEKNIDALTVGAPDHHHAPASAMAIRMGKHCYTEKPLTHSVFEARTLTVLAARHKVATQMGNQGHSSDERRRQVELLQAGILGKVTEVHVWTNRPIWPQGIDRPAREDAVPPNLHWDLWIGPAPMRPYAGNRTYHDFNWRGWWDFGTGALGDMACHVMDAPFWGLGLGTPTRVEAEGHPHKPENGPKWMIVRCDFGPLKLVWYDGGKLPPEHLWEGEKIRDNGYIVVGEKGKLVSFDAQGQKYKFLPEERLADAIRAVPQSLPRVPGGMSGHHQEWIDACKGGPKSLADFSYSGPFTETVLIGIAAFRAQKAFDWDGPNMKAKNCPEVDKYIKREYRKGWSL